MSSTSVTATVESPLDASLVKKASTALLQHLNTAAPKGELIDDAANVFIQIHLKKMPGRSHPKPIQIQLPHAALNPEAGIELCLITKDNADEIKERLIKNPVGGFTKVLSISKLKTKYKEFQHRRELVARFSAFFCDDRVITMMPKLCGKPFISRNKLPTPVRIDRGNLQHTLTEARDATYLYLGKQCVSIKVGRSDMTADQLSANVVAALNAAVPHVAKKWKGIQSVFLHGTGTLGLPLYKSMPIINQMSAEEEEAYVNGDLEGLPSDKRRALADGSDDEDDDEDDADVDDEDDEDNDEEDESAPSKGRPSSASSSSGAAGGKAAGAAAKASSGAAAGSAKPLVPAPAAGTKRPRDTADAGAAPAQAKRPAKEGKGKDSGSGSVASADKPAKAAAPAAPAAKPSAQAAAAGGQKKASGETASKPSGNGNGNGKPAKQEAGKGKGAAAAGASGAGKTKPAKKA